MSYEITPPIEVKNDDSLMEIWEDLSETEKECWVHGHTWYYDVCMDCGARKRMPDESRW